MNNFEVIYEIEFKTVIYEFSVWIAANSQDEALKLAETRPELYMPTAFKETAKPTPKAKGKAETAKPTPKTETAKTVEILVDKTKIKKLNAKLKTKCPVCSKAIKVGDEIQWIKGSPAVCSKCKFPKYAPKYEVKK